MKKTYNTPSIEVIRIEAQQIICMSKLENPVTDPLAPSLTDDELGGFFAE